MKHPKRLLCIVLAGCCVLAMAGFAAHVIWGPEIRYQFHKKDYARFEYIPDENGDIGGQIRHGDVTYTSYEINPDGDVMGEQFGVLDSDPRDEIHAVKGCDTGEWVMQRMNIIMGWVTLYKADHVTEIPAHLQPAENQ